MPGTPVLKFSRYFPGTIWNMLSVPGNNLLILEVRDDKNFQVHFHALDYMSDTFIWENVKMKESWWVGLTAANEKTLLLHSYINKGNPDHKNLVAYDIFGQKIRWEIDEFSFFDWNDSVIWGYRTLNDLIPATVTIETGTLLEEEWQPIPAQERTDVYKPVRYTEGTSHYETVKRFVEQKASMEISRGVEYLEWENRILLSVYLEQGGKLANYLLVFDREGEKLMEEKLGENLPGLGTDTFFILTGCLFLVKNKSELAAYVL